MSETRTPTAILGSRRWLLRAPPRVAVVGGSLTGSATALMLVAAGVDKVTVYEAVPECAPQGGGLISLERAALRILTRIGISPAEYLTHPSLADTEPIEQITVHRRRPTRSVQRTYPGRFTSWSRLHAALTARLPRNVVCRGVRVSGLGERHGTPQLQFADGATAAADLIVFADGRTSTGRRLLDPGRPLRYTGYVAHRGTAPAVAGGPTHFRRYEPGPGAQFTIGPVPGGNDWTFYLAATAHQYAGFFGAVPDRRLFALPRHVTPAARDHVYAEATRLLPAEQAATVDGTVTRSAVPIMDIDPPTRMMWPVGAGLVALLGDALAPVRPHTARGANHGIEQAAGLVTALAAARRGGDLTAALAGWQQLHLSTVADTLHLGSMIATRLGLGSATPRRRRGDRPSGQPVTAAD